MFKLNRRAALISKYACVADDLPKWAKEILTSKMGTVEVTARDSFEIYLLGLKMAKPIDNYNMFSKKFAEIFCRKAFLVLKKIQKNREDEQGFYISNDYFWQEFTELFETATPFKNKLLKSFYKFEKWLSFFTVKIWDFLFKIFEDVAKDFRTRNKTVRRGTRELTIR